MFKLMNSHYKIMIDKIKKKGEKLPTKVHPIKEYVSLEELKRKNSEKNKREDSEVVNNNLNQDLNSKDAKEISKKEHKTGAGSNRLFVHNVVREMAKEVDPNMIRNKDYLKPKEEQSD